MPRRLKKKIRRKKARNKRKNKKTHSTNSSLRSKTNAKIILLEISALMWRAQTRSPKKIPTRSTQILKPVSFRSHPSSTKTTTAATNLPSQTSRLWTRPWRSTASGRNLRTILMRLLCCTLMTRPLSLWASTLEGEGDESTTTAC